MCCCWVGLSLFNRTTSLSVDCMDWTDCSCSRSELGSSPREAVTESSNAKRKSSRRSKMSCACETLFAASSSCEMSQSDRSAARLNTTSATPKAVLTLIGRKSRMGGTGAYCISVSGISFTSEEQIQPATVKHSSPRQVTSPAARSHPSACGEYQPRFFRWRAPSSGR